MAVQAAISGPRFAWQAVPKDQFTAAVTARLADMGAGCVPLNGRYCDPIFIMPPVLDALTRATHAFYPAPREMRPLSVHSHCMPCAIVLFELL